MKVLRSFVVVVACYLFVFIYICFLGACMPMGDAYILRCMLENISGIHLHHDKICNFIHEKCSYCFCKRRSKNLCITLVNWVCSYLCFTWLFAEHIVYIVYCIYQPAVELNEYIFVYIYICHKYRDWVSMCRKIKLNFPIELRSLLDIVRLPVVHESTKTQLNVCVCVYCAVSETMLVIPNNMAFHTI